VKSDVFIADCQPNYERLPLQPDSAVRRSLQSLWRLMGTNPENPFQEYLGKGDTAVIKPNWVLERNYSGSSIECLITHSSLIQCVMEWCAIAMDGEGRVIVGDCPIQGCNFDALLQANGMHDVVRSLQQSYPKIDFEVADWRLTVFAGHGKIKSDEACGHKLLHGHGANVSQHYTVLDAGEESFLEEIADYSDRFRVTMYPPSLLRAHHCQGQHQYLVRNEVLDADLLVNMPKMKTHEKAGLTGALKNMVGVNGHKEFLPHHIKGSYFSGGDSFCQDNRFVAWAEDVYDRLWENYYALPKSRRWLMGKAYAALRAAGRLTGGDRIKPGSWSGNETIWRMTLDLNELLYFGKRRPRHILNIVDGIIAGQGNGPLSPSPKPLGMIFVGENPAHVDAALAKVMGYNVARIPSVYHAVYHRKSGFGGTRLQDIPVHFISQDSAGTLTDITPFGFTPPRHWRRAMSAWPQRNLAAS
jgi:uncharacterized protein (DUF362 family)